MLVELAALLDAHRLRHGDLHVIDTIPIPHRFEHAIGEAERHDVLHRLLSEKMIDAENLLLMQRAQDAGVQLARRVQAIADRLLDHDAAPEPGATILALALTAARSLGLNHLQATWYVIVPQAVRRVIPPLLNDFIGLQKDTALVGILGAVEAFKQTRELDQAASFNFTSSVCAALPSIAITIPLARFTDWLVARDRRRQFAGAPA